VSGAFPPPCLQALSSFGFQYLSQVYLPLKLQEGDWI
jgi:meiotic recombination protein SPO11